MCNLGDRINCWKIFLVFFSLYANNSFAKNTYLTSFIEINRKYCEKYHDDPSLVVRKLKRDPKFSYSGDSLYENTIDGKWYFVSASPKGCAVGALLGKNIFSLKEVHLILIKNNYRKIYEYEYESSGDVGNDFIYKKNNTYVRLRYPNNPTDWVVGLFSTSTKKYAVRSNEIKTDATLTFEVDNSFTQEQMRKEKGLISRTKAAIKQMKIRIRSTMNNRPLNHDYKVKVKTHLLADHDCTAKKKTSQRIEGCSTLHENREISTNEIILTRENNWSSTFKIDSEVALFAVKETWVARYETELFKLEIKPEVVSIEAIK